MGGRPEGGADRCGDMGYATTNGIELRIFCPAVKDMWVARRKIIDCSSKPFSTDLGPAVPGVIYPNVLATGKRSINVSVDGQRAEFSSVFSSCWPAITTVIPSRENRKERRDCDFALYRERNLAERFWNKIKHYRGIATRYDKLARNFLAAVHLVSAIVLLN